MANLFYTYNRLYPGKADVILTAIRCAETEGKNRGLAGSELEEYVSGEILDRVDD